MSVEAFAKALGSRDAVIADLYRDAVDSTIHLDFLLPIRPLSPARADAAGSTSTQPIAIVVLRVNAFVSLFPLIQTWPVPSETAEMLLVRREGQDVVYLNELRHQAGTALHLRRSMDDPSLPGALGLSGDAAVREGIDYRGTR